jgi:hypothetical protein
VSRLLARSYAFAIVLGIILRFAARFRIGEIVGTCIIGADRGTTEQQMMGNQAAPAGWKTDFELARPESEIETRPSYAMASISGRQSNLIPRTKRLLQLQS